MKNYELQIANAKLTDLLNDQAEAIQAVEEKYRLEREPLQSKVTRLKRKDRADTFRTFLVESLDDILAKWDSLPDNEHNLPPLWHVRIRAPIAKSIDLPQLGEVTARVQLDIRTSARGPGGQMELRIFAQARKGPVQIIEIGKPQRIAKNGPTLIRSKMNALREGYMSGGRLPGISTGMQKTPSK